MRIVIICPIRDSEPERELEVQAYMERLREAGHQVFSYFETEMEHCPTGSGILEPHLRAVAKAQEVHVFWDETSRGSHFELGSAAILGKKIVFVRLYTGLPEGQSYVRALLERGPAEVELRVPDSDLQRGRRA